MKSDMDDKFNKNYSVSELRYYCSIGSLALMGPLALGAVLWLLPPAQATDNWDVEGANGILYVQGALTESACRLEMTSMRQDILLGEVGTGRLKHPGDRGEPVRFELRLEDCLRSSAAARDERTDALTWADNQPAISVRFNAVRDADNPMLVQAQGVTGVGLRLEDSQGQDVRLGSRGKALLLQPGQNTLNYTVTPERTSADMMPGSYSSMVDFHLSYD
jgi:type 1 fimbria pilin